MFGIGRNGDAQARFFKGRPPKETAVTIEVMTFKAWKLAELFSKNSCASTENRETSRLNLLEHFKDLSAISKDRDRHQREKVDRVAQTLTEEIAKYNETPLVRNRLVPEIMNLKRQYQHDSKRLILFSELVSFNGMMVTYLEQCAPLPRETPAQTPVSTDESTKLGVVTYEELNALMRSIVARFLGDKAA